MKSILLVMGLILITSQVQADRAGVSQSKADAKRERLWSVLPELGITSIGVTEAEGSNKTGLSLGVLANYSLDDYVLEFGLSYMQIGNSQENIFASLETNLDYLALPLLVRKSIWERSDNSDFYVRGGLVPSYLMVAEVEGKFFGESLGKEDIKDQFKEFNLLAKLGFGLNYLVGDNMSVLGDINYVHGLTEIDDAGSKTHGWTITSALSIEL